jgi:hypothetical protein
MTALFNRVGDRLLQAVLPQEKAAASYCWWACGYCYPGMCIDYYRCSDPGSTAPGYGHCIVRAGSYSWWANYCC